MAAACGLAVANLYYAQPILHLLARSFGVGVGGVTLVVTVTQVGYAIGLFVMLPLGDLFEARRLTPLMLLVTALGLAAAALATSVAWFMVASLVVGVTCVVAQILVPFAAHLAPEESRGRVVGRVMSGLLLGILLARTVSSLAAAALGWRAIFWISSAMMVLLAGALWVLLPGREPDHKSGYVSLMTSVVGIARDLPRLRVRAICQALVFVAFSGYWTSIAYELIGQHGYTQADVGLFALVGATGAAVAPFAGRLADHGHGRWFGGLALATGLVAMASAGFGDGSIVLLGLGGVLLDVCVTGHQIVSQREIYGLRPDARARITTVFMGTVFVFGALGSALAGVLYRSNGWGAVIAMCAVSIGLSFLIWGVTTLRARGEATVS
jgi:predicted MFS family arabinose efflux permease